MKNPPILPAHRPTAKGALLLVVICLLLAACGGGGGGGGAPVTTPSTASGPPFPPSSQFKSICKMPRNTEQYMDMLNTEDTANTWRVENSWLRSWSDETYLWHDQIDHATYPLDDYISRPPREYFAVLKTFATTPSGKDLDEFHFTEDTITSDRRATTNADVGYGLTLARIVNAQGVFNGQYAVRYVEKGSPADMAGITRGALFLGIHSDSAQEDALFSPTEGASNTFGILLRGAAQNTEVTLTAAVVTGKSVPIAQVLTTSNNEKVGYLLLNPRPAP